MLALGVLGGTLAQGDELITNGGFEVDDFYAAAFGLQPYAWGVIPYGMAGIGWHLNDGTFSPPNGVFGQLPPIEGGWDIVADSLGGGSMFLLQVFDVPDDVSSATLSWSYRIRSLNYYHYYSPTEYPAFVADAHEVRVVLRDFSMLPVALLFATQPDDPEIQGVPDAVRVEHLDITAILQNRPGQQLVLSFEVDSYMGYLDCTLDSVSLLVNETGGGGDDDPYLDLPGLDVEIDNFEFEIDGETYTLQEALEQLLGDESLKNDGQFAAAISDLTNYLKKQGLLTGEQKGVLQSWAAQADR